ncbi:heat shock protein [Bradyrhizobium sp. R2.2-H]|jgi:heat shock protein HtpX|uniref:M48 family metallopeptidase n=1 Tax=unclassified Bradyrhizobium TaxID=2631580 RepID=UPI0010502935|nr:MULTISPECIES: M48 family metallopeptidase [unclassified Bradyrhizobium]TCU78366.1 heat shock protein [Bradyrhizobium sp. Y-H1]TCU80450.1 heat shock protein [Bradyrhizobium sp. R2.2-H]
MAAYGLYTHIASNKFRSMLLLAGLFALVYVLVYAGALVAEVVINGNGTVAYYLSRAFTDLLKAAPFATIAAALWIVIAYFFHQSMIDAVTGGHGVTRQEEPRLYNLLENLCISRGITMPKLKIMESPALNAFATGLNPRQYSITVTTGLLAALNDKEIEAVLGHELTHIKNGDVQLMVVAVIIAGVVGFFGELFFRLFTNFNWSSGGSGSSSRSSSSSSDSKSSGGGAVIVIIIAIVLIVVAWLLSQVVKLALSRSREFLADAGSVELTKDPDAMISALRKIEGRGELPGATSAVMELCVDNPREGFADLFATHPSVQSRVDALVKFAGGHDPGPLPDPAEETDQPATEQPEAQANSQDAQPPRGPWNDAGNPAGPPPVPAPGPSGAPADNAMGPWGRH